MEKKIQEKRPNIDLLQSVLHNAEIGIYAIDCILPEVTSEKLIQILKTQKKKLQEITDKTKNLGQKNNIELKPNSYFKKSKMWMAIKMNSFWDDDTQHLSEMLSLGYFMSIVNMIKSLADCKKAKADILTIAKELKKIEEDSLNELVPFLERTKK